MLEAFVNPWSMAAGTLLVSVPIIIHLINRLRFKRIRWAAMEFLLKAQKRMKRKLILQQLLLLLLRCLMIFLLGMLVGRFLGFNPFQGRESRATTHYAILDDSPSMADGWREDSGAMLDSFEAAKRLLTEKIMDSASLATNPQLIEVVRTSDNTPRGFGRINAATKDELKSYLNGVTPSTVRGSLIDSLKKAKSHADADGQDMARIVHVFSDFRGQDWEIDGPALRQALDELIKSNIKVHLIDVAHPYRRDQKRPQFHDNVAIVELTPSRRVVPRFEQTEFTLRVRNYGAAELKDLRFSIAVNGDDNRGQSVVIPTLPGNQEEQVRFKLTLDRVGSTEKPLERFSLISAKLETPPQGDLAADNTRYAVVEVRERLPILAIDGRPAEREKKEGDSFYLRNIFTNVQGGYTWQPGTARDLETQDLRQFSCIMLMNVPAVSEDGAKKLEKYVRDGGGVGIFLGPDVKPSDYNSLLYRDGAGILPAPLPEKPSDPLPDDKVLEKLFNFQKKILLRDKAMMRHEALFNIYFNDRGREDKENSQGLEKFFNFVLVRQYWPIKRLGKWRDDPSVQELYCLPNDAAMGQYEPPAIALMNRLPADEPKYAKYKEVLTAMKNDIRRTASSTEPLFKLANVLDRLLSDQISEGDAAEALLREFWSLPENTDLKSEAMRLRDAVKYGDPLYFAKTFGRGRVTMMTTTAGEQWTDWPAGPGGRSFPPIMSEMERFLSGGGADDSAAVGTPLNLQFEAAQYKPEVGRAFLTVDYSKDSPTRIRPADIEDIKPQTMVAEQDMAKLDFKESTKPGAYIFTFQRVKSSTAGGEAAEVPEYQARAFNIDAAHEGDLRRAGRDDILQQLPGVNLHSLADDAWLDELKNKRTDLTEAGWIFLLLLLVLIGEQWLATRLSFHTANQDAQRFAPSTATYKSTPTEPVATAA